MASLLTELSTPLHERTDEGKRRYVQALAYSWGREDAGDHDLVDMVKGMGITVDAHTIFAAWAASHADDYARGKLISLPDIHNQYTAFRLGAAVFLVTYTHPTMKEDDGESTQPK